jgi:hypothetical protein
MTEDGGAEGAVVVLVRLAALRAAVSAPIGMRRAGRSAAAASAELSVVLCLSATKNHAMIDGVRSVTSLAGS